MQEANQANATFPERIYELAREHRVGMPIKAYYQSMFWYLLLFYTWITVFAISLPIGIYNYKFDQAEAKQSAQFYASCQTCSQANTDVSSQLNATILANDEQTIERTAGFILIGLFGLAYTFYVRKKTPLYRCSDGLLLLSTGKEKVSALQWSEIAEVYWKKDRMWSLCKANDEQSWNLTNFRNSHDIHTYIEPEITPRLFSQMLAQYKQTGKVYFGVFSIKHEGLVMSYPTAPWKDESLVLWQDLEDIRFADGVLSIKLQGEWKGWGGGLH